MGFRFRKRIKILPGFWFNLSKSGISTSIGGKGLTVNLKGGKVKTTASLHGTGLSYSETTGGRHEAQEASASDTAPAQHRIPAWVWIVLAAVVLMLLIN